MAPLVSLLHRHGVVEAVNYRQLKCFEAAITFSRAEGIIVAPETSHAVACVIDEALKAKEEGKENRARRSSVGRQGRQSSGRGRACHRQGCWFWPCSNTGRVKFVAENGFTVAAGKRAEGIVGVGDRTEAVPAHDHVVLGFEKAGGAFLGFPDFPIAVRRLVEARPQGPAARPSSGGCGRSGSR